MSVSSATAMWGREVTIPCSLVKRPNWSDEAASNEISNEGKRARSSSHGICSRSTAVRTPTTRTAVASGPVAARDTTQKRGELAAQRIRGVERRPVAAVAQRSKSCLWQR